MSTRIGTGLRQWVALPGASCDLRVGEDVLDEVGTLLRGAVGRPHACMLVMSDDVTDNVSERLRRQLTDAGFAVRETAVKAGADARTLACVDALATQLAAAAITSDDLIVAVGDSDMLSVVTHVAGAWQGGTPLAVVPVSFNAAVTAVATPRGIDVGGVAEAIAVRGCARHALCDLRLIGTGIDRDTLALAEMAATALCESEKAVALLWDNAAGVVAGDPATLCAQLAASAKGRGQVASSSSAAVRASGAYGTTFARALLRLAPDVDAGIALGEGLRFCVRIAAGMGLCSVDDVLTHDELLERLSVGLAVCEVQPEALVEAIREERFRRTNRLMLELARSLGRVRLSTVDESLLLEHARAWCRARSR